MLIQNYNELDIEKVRESIPIYCESRLSYFRRENEGNYTFIIRNGFTNELHVNAISYEILHLCIGNQTIRDIAKEIASRYPTVNFQNIEHDVVQVIKKFDALNLIDWGKDGSPFMKNYVKEVKDKFIVKLAEEKDIREISKFYRNFLSVQNIKSTFYLYPPRDHAEYLQELFLRHKLFSYTEDFFLIYFKNNKNICGVVSIKSNKAISAVGVVGTIAFSEIESTEFVEIITQIINSYVELCFPLCKKIEIQFCPSKNNYSSVLEDTMSDIGLEKEAVLKSEFPEENGDLIIYSRFLVKEK